MDTDKFKRQYDYKANSNLVLTADKSLIDKRPGNEATGEVQSLAGRLKGRMGDRVEDLALVTKSDVDKKAIKKKKTKSSSKMKLDVDNLKGRSVADMETDDLMYKPKSEETSKAFALITRFVQRQLGFQPISIVNVAAEEIIRTFKDPSQTEAEKRDVITQLLTDNGELDDGDYNEICNLCKKINDWNPEPDAAGGDGDQNQVYNVNFSESEQSDDLFSELGISDDEDDEKPEAIDTNEEKYDLEKYSDKQMFITPVINLPEPIRTEHYLEYQIEPTKPSSHGIKRIPIRELSSIEQKAFDGMNELNIIQSKIYDKAINSDKSLLICAPTGAGKTNIAILTMLREMMRFQHHDKPGFDTRKFKIIYVAPIKALVQEIVENFTKRLGKPFNLVVEELTGDHQLDQRQISNAQIIVCTPEKWDIVTRKSLDRLYTKVVRLVIFDEIHLLHNERGATLEALVARIKRHKLIEGEPIRIIGLSATLPNYDEVRRFLGPEDATDYEFFDGSYRPIPLKQQYVAMKDSKKSFRLINDIVYRKAIERLSQNSQILVFVHSRPDTVKTADFIKTKAFEENKLGLFLSESSARDEIEDQAKSLRPNIKELVRSGVGVHHAGMSRDERAAIEYLFKGKFIKVLVSTATLAWGVNLPARIVIIKGTQVYRNGNWTNLDSLDITQMLGRAGRPGFDTQGEGIVITQESQVHFYMSLMTAQLPVESRLIPRLAEFINAECVVGNIKSTEDASQWISETFLYQRMLRVLNDTTNSQSEHYRSMYGLDYQMTRTDPKLRKHTLNLAYSALDILERRGLIQFDRQSGIVESTELGRIASHYNCSSGTAKKFNDQINEHTQDVGLLKIFSQADEFKDIFVRRGEEVDLEALIKNQVPIPIGDKQVISGQDKVNALLQVYIYRMNIDGSDLICDMHFIKDNASRLARAILEIALMKRYAPVVELAFDLCRKIDKRMSARDTPLRQYANDLDAQVITKLESKAYRVDELMLLDVNKLGEILRIGHDQKKVVYNLLRCLPKLNVRSSVRPTSSASLRIDLYLEPEFTWNEKYHKTSVKFTILIEDVNQEVILHSETVFVRPESISSYTKTTFYVPIMKTRNMEHHPFYYMRVFADDWIGCDQHIPIMLTKLVLPRDKYEPTELMDLEAINFSSCHTDRHAKVVDTYERNFAGASFNPIQTQSYKHLYESDKDVVLLAPAGSGKTLCAELAIMRLFNGQSSKSKVQCGYVAANEKAASTVYNQWMETFGQTGHYILHLLTGNRKQDLSLIKKQSANIIIGDPASWYSLTLVEPSVNCNDKSELESVDLMWPKQVQKIGLFVVDDIHLMFDDTTCMLEWLMSKLKEMSRVKRARIVALGSPMSTCASIDSWLAFTKYEDRRVLLNFAPSIRPVRLVLNIMKFQHHNFRLRRQTMERPVFMLAMEAANQNKPTFVFVSDYTVGLDVCESLYGYSKSEGCRQTTNLHVSEFVDRNLCREYLDMGIGLLHSAMDSSDKRQMELLYAQGKLRIIVITVGSCWSLNDSLRPYQTIIMDTQHYNGLDSFEYKLTDMMQIIGLTGRPLIDHECKCYVMCHTSKHDYYQRFLNEPLYVESNLLVPIESCVSGEDDDEEYDDNDRGNHDYEEPKRVASESKLFCPLNSFINCELAAGSLMEFSRMSKPFLAHSYLYKRITRNPSYYQLFKDDHYDSNKIKEEKFKHFFVSLVNRVASDLEFKNMLERVKPPSTNDAASHELLLMPKVLSTISLDNNIHYETLAGYADWLKGDSMNSIRSPMELIELIAERTIEFKQSLCVRYGERDSLRELCKIHKRYNDIPLLHDLATKVKLLMLSVYNHGQPDHLEGELIEDRHYVVELCYRLLSSLVSIAGHNHCFNLLKEAMDLIKRFNVFDVTTRPNLELSLLGSSSSLDSDEPECRIVTLKFSTQRENEPFTMDTFSRDCRHLPEKLFRPERWAFIVHSRPKEPKVDTQLEERIQFRPVRVPNKGTLVEPYEISVELDDKNATKYTYDLYFKSDFYGRKEDRSIRNIDLANLSSEED